MKNIPPYIAHGDGNRDCRYSVTHEHTGGQAAKYVARFCGEFIVACDCGRHAWQAAERHARGRGFGGMLVDPDATIAQTIASTAHNSNDAMLAADAIVEGSQDWENETTTWEFSDGSRLVVSAGEWSAT